MTAKSLGIDWVGRIFIGLLLVIFAVIVVHAPLSVWLGTTFPAADLVIKAWKEILMIAAGLLALLLIARKRRWDIFLQPLILLSLLYGVVHLILIPVFYDNATATIAGLLIDLRYVIYFALVLIMMQLYPSVRQLFLGVLLVGALLVGTFALLQVFVLPPDILSVIGYGDSTISPYLTVDENPEYVRINSTLRGPNPLGAYAVVILSLMAAYWLKVKRPLIRKPLFITGWLSIAMLVALWTSYSRSALVAAVVALGIVFIMTIGRRLPRWVWVAGFVAVFAIAGGLFAARDTSFVSNVILHENEGTGAAVSSNDGHAESLVDGSNRMLNQPLGAGIGSTGSASLYTDKPVIIENQYLFIAHEAGWIGLIIFLVLFGVILAQLWKGRRDWLAVGVFASGIGLALIGLLLPVWVDDTVSVIWWGLAGLAVGGMYGGTVYKKAKRTA